MINIVLLNYHTNYLSFLFVVNRVNNYSKEYNFLSYISCIFFFRQKKKQDFFWLSNVRKNAWNFSITTWKCWFKPWRTILQQRCFYMEIDTDFFYYIFKRVWKIYEYAYPVHNYIRIFATKCMLLRVSNAMSHFNRIILME